MKVINKCNSNVIKMTIINENEANEMANKAIFRNNNQKMKG